MSESKQKIINDIYFDRAGFGSKSNTLKDAKEKDSSIKMSDVERFFKEKVEMKKRKPRGTNSFVAPSNNHTYQMDFFFWVNMILTMNKISWWACDDRFIV